MKMDSVADALDSTQDDEIKAEHMQLKQDLAAARAEREFWKGTVENPYFESLTMEWEMQVQNYREALESAKGDDIKTLQSDIRSRKSLLKILQDKNNGENVAHAREALKRFETQNALLLGLES